MLSHASGHGDPPIPQVGPGLVCGATRAALAEHLKSVVAAACITLGFLVPAFMMAMVARFHTLGCLVTGLAALPLFAGLLWANDCGVSENNRADPPP